MEGFLLGISGNSMGVRMISVVCPRVADVLKWYTNEGDLRFSRVLRGKVN